jgi:hypothetical protein
MSGSVLPNNEWVHIAMTYDGQTLRSYVNGKLDTYRVDVSGDLLDANTYLTIGSKYTGDYFDGAIDDLALFNTVLSDEEIARVMVERLSGEEDGLVAYYSLASGLAVDETKRGHDGTLYGDTRIFKEVERSRTGVTRRRVGQGRRFRRRSPRMVLGPHRRLQLYEDTRRV